MAHYDEQRERHSEDYEHECSRKAIKQVLQEVMDDVMQVFDFGYKKHPDNGAVPNFLTASGNKCARMIRGNSCLHHAADLRAGVKSDHESNLHPALHLISSAVILYIREKRNIVHPDDVKSSAHKSTLTGLCGWSYAGETLNRSDK